MTYSTGVWPISVSVNDVNDDSNLDIVVANFDDSSVSVLLGYGDGLFANQITYATRESPIFVSVLDFNKDTRLDIIVIHFNKNGLGIFWGSGNGSFEKEKTYLLLHRPWSAAFADLNNDTHMDIIVGNANMAARYVSVFLVNTKNILRKQTMLTTGNQSFPQAFAIADFNNDTHMDIAVANSRTNNVGIFLGYGNLSFTDQTTYSTGSFPCSIAIGDLNNDSQPDIVVANFDDSNVSVLLGDGRDSFRNQKTYLTGVDSQPYAIALADFDNDTRLDIIVANDATNNVVILLGHGDGTFSSAKQVFLDYGSHPFAIAVGDFNKDQKLDFVVANTGTDNLKIVLQTC